MELWKDKETFRGLVVNAAKHCGVPEAAVEKDLYVIEALRRIKAENPSIIFKGGTSLSKAYQAISRFSEDLDLSVVSKDVSDSSFTRDDYRSLLSFPVERALKKMGFENEPELRESSSPKYYCYNQSLDAVLFKDSHLNRQIKIESTLISKPFPVEERTVVSYIGEYLLAAGFKELAERYGLLPFPVLTQSIERTAVDKLCAICDYYLEKKARRNSRHIYDVYQISKQVDYDSPLFRELAKTVFLERKKMDRAYSANDGVSMNALYQAMLRNRFYEDDYNAVTLGIVFEKDPPSYEKASGILKRIIELGLFE